jgi:hypothetical protein
VITHFGKLEEWRVDLETLVRGAAVRSGFAAGLSDPQRHLNVTEAVRLERPDLAAWRQWHTSGLAMVPGAAAHRSPSRRGGGTVVPYSRPDQPTNVDPQ